MVGSDKGSGGRGWIKKFKKEDRKKEIDKKKDWTRVRERKIERKKEIYSE